ncbi:MAG: recombinase family protein [Sulfurimonas sp.]|nr:recombinase family protein [Sulfurimonas sp.]MBL1245123.1 recombinase family protein [Sulfurimonas sp.]
MNEHEAQLIIVRDKLVIGDDMSSKLLTTMFGIVSEIERDRLKSCVKEGLDAAKARGVKLGRKPGPGKSKLDPQRELI